MGFGMFASQQSPIAIDFGSSSVKLMQLDKNDPPSLIAAAELAIPESLRTQPAAALGYVGAELPSLLKSAEFQGKKAVTAIPSGLTYTQHMQVAESPGVKLDDIVKGQLQMQMNCASNSLVVRSITVPDAKCRDQSRTEVICFAASRDVIMRYVQLLNKCKLEVTGMHTEAFSTVWAFAHLNQRQDDGIQPTMYINLGWNGTVVSVSHGTKMVFARHIHIGGHHFDQQMAQTLKCELHEAATQRYTLEQPLTRESATSMNDASPDDPEGAAMQANGETDKPGHVAIAIDRRTDVAAAELLAVPESAEAASIIQRFEFTELIDTLVDEISMGLRYHRGLYPNLPISRVFLVGGESRQAWLTRTITDHLKMDTFVGDPLRRFAGAGSPYTPGLSLDDPNPGWAVACGLSFAPSDA